MIKVKIFTSSDIMKLQKEVQEFLKNVQTILNVTQSEDSNDYITLSIFYR